MPLKIRLKPEEKIVVNGAVLSVGGSHAATLVLHNKAAVLRGRDILLPEGADTPIKRVYFAIQLLYLDPEGAEGYAAEYRRRMDEVLAIATSPALRDALTGADARVAAGDLYGALALLRDALDHEARLLGTEGG